MAVLLLVAGILACQSHGWTDPQSVRDKIERYPGFGPELQRKQPGIWAVLQDPTGHYLKVRLRLDGPCVISPGSFRVTTPSGETMVDSGSIILIGSPSSGQIADARQGPVRVHPRHAHRGELFLTVRFPQRLPVSAVTFSESGGP